MTLDPSAFSEPYDGMWRFGGKCRTCGKKHDGLPTCFGMDAPWRAFVPEDEFESRVELAKSLCVVDEKHFFIRGHIEIPIIDYAETFAFSAWSSLSEKSFEHVKSRWNAEGRANDAPYFGWLSTPVAVYRDTINLPLSVQTSAPGCVPLFTVKDSNHPLAIEQANGISKCRWHELVTELMR